MRDNAGVSNETNCNRMNGSFQKRLSVRDVGMHIYTVGELSNQQFRVRALAQTRCVSKHALSQRNRQTRKKRKHAIERKLHHIRSATCVVVHVSHKQQNRHANTARESADRGREHR